MEESEGVERDFAERCQEALVSAVRECKSRFPSCAILLSGGVDTAAILEANRLLRTDSIVIENAVTVLTAECEAFDRPYAGVVSRRHQLQNHTLVDVPLDTFLQFAPLCIRALRTFDGMTLRNSLVIAAVSFVLIGYAI
jgi:asparagine synthetase B (glutamine-hydrolysing)